MNYLAIVTRKYFLNYAGVPKHCWEAITLTFLDAISSGLTFFLSLYFVERLHMSVPVAGTLISIYGIGRVIGGLIGGKLTDNFSNPQLLFISLFGEAIAFFLLCILQQTIILAFVLLLLGIFSYIFKTANNFWMLTICNENENLKLKTINLAYAASNLGIGLAGVMFGWFSLEHVINAFLIASLILLLSAIYILFNKCKRDYNCALTNASKIKDSSKTTNKVILLMLFSVFLIGLVLAQLSSTYPIYIKNRYADFGVNAVSILFVLDTILIVIFQAPLVNLLKQYNKIMIVGLGAFLMGFGMFILTLSKIFFIAILSCTVWTTGEMLFMSMAQLVCYEHGAVNKKGQSLGIFQATYAASCVLGPAAGGIVYEYIGGNWLWYLSCFFGIVIFSTCWQYKKYETLNINYSN